MRNRPFLAIAFILLTQGTAPPPSRADFLQTNLVSDITGLALERDTNLKNPWGMSFSSSSPIWVSNQATNTATLYNPLSSPITQGLVVTLPTAGNGPPMGPTGQVFNSTTSDFMIPAPGSTTVKSTFLFATLDGTLQGWNPGSNAGLHATEPVGTVPGAVFTGLALNNIGGTNYLYAADATGSIRVFDSKFTNVTGTIFAGKFVDPNPVAGFTPYNIQTLNGNLFVTYAAATKTGAPLPGGYVDEFDSAGNFLMRIATNGALNAPWGLAIAPNGFGTFGGDLLVGNLFDSTINAYSLTAPNTLEGSIKVQTGFASPVGLWGLAFGNSKTGDPNTLYFTAGINDQKDGLFGAIESTDEPATFTLLSLGLMALAGYRLYWRRGKAFA
jgi:uncharacterized protein (TIGR03118 family)